MSTIRILIVDDSPAFLESASHFLAADRRLRVVGQTRSGQEALERVSDLRPDLVLMDIRMPGINGLETTRRIKSQPHPPRVIILTLYDSAEYRTVAESIGADGFLAKSDFGQRLLPLIHQLFDDPRMQPPKEQANMKNILVVDDSATMRRMVIAALRVLKDIHFIEASNGLDAIEKLALAPVDLMTLDLNMPDMHGLDVLRFVRRHQAYRNLPIIVLTTRGDETSRSNALAAGASVYLTKPFQPSNLVEHAHGLLSAGSRSQQVK